MLLLFFFPLLLSSCFFSDEKEVRPKKPPLPPLEQLAISLSEKGFLVNKQRMIVLTFTNTDGTKSPYGTILSEKLTTELVKKDRFLVLDRMAMEKTLKEKGLSLDSDLDMATLRKIGEVLNVDILVTGILSAYQGGVFINTRLIDIKTGLILKAEEVYVLIDG
ncbi:curli production assembly/transport component CsgG domain protein [Leptospira idonii]|uniref:Curli production assembly/transport component CsgG domain protein n=1 Tax=Leptospira idonii TaxID=1193500 RepID=A0A4V3JY32_9LEPT|nr:curli production assembly/transport component CsgG domain protein [Leptospira idonii]